MCHDGEFVELNVLSGLLCPLLSLSDRVVGRGGGRHMEYMSDVGWDRGLGLTGGTTRSASDYLWKHRKSLIKES